MLATLVIGLREGLEAALIVGIIAAFLRSNGKSLVAMWIGVAAAVVLSVAVGAALSLVEQALPQAAQEGMESVIGAIAVVFVTGMVVWMNTHARGMKRELEGEAQEALGQGGAYALAVMAFLAVLKEGFETSVFLLATFSAAESATLAAVGAVIGILAAVAIGWGIYAGGVRLNLSRFFRVTGAFLILVAAGLVMTTLRTAHEAGWLDAGQQPTVRLTWLVQPGTVQSALITGVLGIPVDPRLIEVVGWFAYLIPVALYVYWPRRHRPSAAASVRLRYVIAGALGLTALLVAVTYPVPSVATSPEVALTSSAGGSDRIGTARLDRDAHGRAELAATVQGRAFRVSLSGTSERAEHAGVAATTWSTRSESVTAGAPTILTMEQLVSAAGGRLPVGVDPQQDPGPFEASWTTAHATTVWATGGYLLDAEDSPTTIVTLSGGGLRTPRTITAADASAPTGWQVAPAAVARTASAVQARDAAVAERALWAIGLPVALLLAAALVLTSAVRARSRLRPPAASTHSDGAQTSVRPDPEKRNTSYATH